MRIVSLLQILLLLLSAAMIMPSPAQAADCSSGVCAAKTTELATAKKTLATCETYLKKNKDYLAEHVEQNNTSAGLKVKSNILIIQLKIEASKNNIQAMNSQLTTSGCQACLTK